MPSASTSARLAPLAPRPRSDTPWAVGLAVPLEVLRKSEKPTTWRSASSRNPDAVASRAARGRIATLAGVSPIRVSARAAVTVSSSTSRGGVLRGLVLRRERCGARETGGERHDAEAARDQRTVTGTSRSTLPRRHQASRVEQ